MLMLLPVLRGGRLGLGWGLDRGLRVWMRTSPRDPVRLLPRDSGAANFVRLECSFNILISENKFLLKLKQLRKRLNSGPVFANREYAAGVPANKRYAAGKVPANKEYAAGTL